MLADRDQGPSKHILRLGLFNCFALLAMSVFLSPSSCLAPRSIHRSFASCQTDSPASHRARSEHWCIPIQILAIRSGECPWLQNTDLNMSGTMNNRTCDPRMYTRSRWVTLPSRWVTLIFSSCTFMLSSANLSLSVTCGSVFSRSSQ